MQNLKSKIKNSEYFLEARLLTLTFISEQDKWCLFRYFFISPAINNGSKDYVKPERKQNLKGLKSICESVMKDRSIYPSEARIVRFKAVNSFTSIKTQSEICPAIRPFALLSSKLLNEAGNL